MKFALIGAGQLGREIFRAAAGQRLVVDMAVGDAGALFQNAELGCTTHLWAAAECQMVAVTVPANACGEIFNTLCPLMQPGSVLLNFSTNWDIPEGLRDRFPYLRLLDAKLLGSAAGMAQGMESLVVLDGSEGAIIDRVRDYLPGLKIISGDCFQVRSINVQATKAALSAAIALEKSLESQGVPADMIGTAVGGLMPGVLVSYHAGTLGAFGREVVSQLKNTAFPDSSIPET
ncbi:MAG: hypothetical protein AB7E30_10360 [Lawsonibacter sp.]